ncbi:MAG: 2-oxoglutarate dehydrogenase, subunit, partial [Arthrobacter sp.]|nr:2-oxoglutarate dehydrogenase, subunit [Arthrobacter sp.]
MPEQPSHRLPEEFGGNEWLVDELYEQYQQDKNAVDAKWWPLFESFDSGSSSSSNGNSGQATANPPTRQMP